MPFIVFIAFFCLGIALRQGTLMDPDTGWHIAAGALIRSDGPPHVDPWSYAAQGATWYDISWAYDAAVSALYDLGGLPAVAAASILFYALAVALMGAIALRSSKSLIASVMTTALLGFVLLPGMLARPQTVTYLLILAVYAILRWGRPRAIWTLPVLTMIWANIHGGFLAAFVILGAFFLETLGAKDYKRGVRLVAVGALCGLAALVNPYGWGIFTAAQLTMHSAMRDVLMEWRPLEFNEASPAVFFIGAFVLVSALFERRIPLADKILAGFWLAMGLSSARMMHIAALLGAPYLAQAIALRLRQSPFGSAFEQRDNEYSRDLARPGVRAVLAGVSVLIVALGFAPPAQRALAANGEAFVEMPPHIAVDGALDFAKTHYKGARIFANYGLGGYLIFRDRGATPVFVDGRADTAHARATLQDAIVIDFMNPRKAVDADYEAKWRALVERYGIEAFLTARNARLDAYLSRAAGWTRVYADDDAAFYVRSDLAKAGENAVR